MNHILARVHVATFLAHNGTHGTLLCSDWKRCQACAVCAVWCVCVATTLSYDNRFVGLRMSPHDYTLRSAPRSRTRVFFDRVA
jgi:hypothetical protein